MTDLIVRPPVAGDRASWEALFRAYAAFYEVPMTAGTLETVWAWIQVPAHVVDALVAERGGSLVGLAHYRAMPSPLRGATLGFLDDLFVEPAARGTKVGEELLAHLAGIAAERGWRCVRRSTPSQKNRLHLRRRPHTTVILIVAALRITPYTVGLELQKSRVVRTYPLIRKSQRQSRCSCSCALGDAS